jgi:PAS domain-containing protein
MDEFQFIESLDALLANEAIDETTTAAVELVNTSISPVHGQGILSGPTGPGQIAEITGTTWLAGNDNNRSNSDPYTMPLHLNAGLNSVNTTQAVEAASFPQYSSAFVEQQAGTGSDSTQKMLGALLLSAPSPVPMCTPMLQTKIMTATNKTTIAPSGVMSVCSATSRGSSNASSSRRRGKSNNSTTSVGSATSPGSKTTKSESRKRIRGETSMAVSDSEDDCSRRRHDRNLREQRRSQKITHQIDQLREVLAAASVRFKPDKYSTLVSVVQYVKQLQLRSTMLDMEHKKLLDTITRTNEMVNEPYATSGTSAVSSTGNIGSSSNCGIGTDAAKPDSALSGCVGGNDNANEVPNGGGGHVYNDDELVFVRNVDYKCIFDRCGMPLAVASIDGRLMDCNHEFVKLTGYRREELLPNEKHQNQNMQQGLQRQGSTIIADDVGSSFFSSSIFPDEPASSCSINDNSKKTKKELDVTTTNAACHMGHAEIRNFSLFNLLSRNNMEEVFMSLSEMLKQPPKDESGMSSVSKADYWSGNVRLSRNTHLEIRINVSLVRSPQGRAKFFDCSLTPLPL